MAKKWKDIRVSPPPKPLTPEEHEAHAERLGRLDKFCEGMEPTAQLLGLADRYRLGEITFEEFEATARR